MKAHVYARYSTDHQSESSITDQVRVCEEYAATKGWPVGSVHSDEGISGAALGNRPGARAAMSAAVRGDFLLVTDLSRLSRSQDLAPLVTRLRHRGVRVIGVQDGYDSDSRTARMQAGLSGIMSEEFRAMVADRTRSALELRARTGQATGGKAYENPEVVRELFARYAAGDTLKAIVSDLNHRGVPSPGANWKQRASPRGKWLVSALFAILRNERYVGRLVWNRSQWVKDPDTGKRTRHERPESEWIIQRCEPLVDEVTWARVQARCRTHEQKGGVRRYLLSGLLECAACGSKMIVMGGSQHRYVCGAYHQGGEHACSNTVTVPRLLAEQAILEPVMDDMLSPEAVSAGVRMLIEARKDSEAPAPRDSEEVTTLQRLVREGILSPATAAPALAEARRKAKAPTPTNLPWPSEKLWREAVANMRTVLTSDDVPAAREMLRGLVGTVRLRRDGAEALAEFEERPLMMATGTVDRLVAGACYAPTYRSVRIPTTSRGRA
jgi:site-specific DNA recombinase